MLEVEIAECAFADDLIVFAKIEQNLQAYSKLLKVALQKQTKYKN